FADAYSDAARLSNAPMQQAVDVLEPLRAKTIRTDDAYAGAQAFDAAVCEVVGDPLLPVVMKLRDRYLEAVGDLATRLVTDAIEADTDHGLRTWRRTLAEAFGEYRIGWCERLVRPGWLPDAAEPSRVVLATMVDRAR